MSDDLFIPRPKGRVAREQPHYVMGAGHLRMLFDRLAKCDSNDEAAIEQLIFDHIYETCKRKRIPIT